MRPDPGQMVSLFHTKSLPPEGGKQKLSTVIYPSLRRWIKSRYVLCNFVFRSDVRYRCYATCKLNIFAILNDAICDSVQDVEAVFSLC